VNSDFRDAVKEVYILRKKLDDKFALTDEERTIFRGANNKLKRVESKIRKISKHEKAGRLTREEATEKRSEVMMQFMIHYKGLRSD
jgi:hypothetical protein